MQNGANRGKQSKSQTPTRHTHIVGKPPQLIGIGKKSDPFLKELREVYDKQNINPNIKQVRIKSFTNKVDVGNDKHSPVKKIMYMKNNRQANPINKPKEGEQMNSNSKFNHSTQLNKPCNRGSNRKSTEKDQPHVNNFLQEYYSKEQKRDKKMKVTLKDIKKQRKSVQESDQYMTRIPQQARESISRDSHNCLKNQTGKNQSTMIDTLSKESSSINHQSQSIEDYRCSNHPDKKATHRLIDSDCQEKIHFCQKCAVNYVTKGYRMMQLNQINQLGQLSSINKKVERDSEIRELRNRRLRDFLFEVDLLQPMFRDTKGGINLSKEIIESRYIDQQSKLGTYFSKVKQQVQSAYDKALFNLKMYYESVYEQLQRNEEILCKSYVEIADIKQDILPHIAKIVELAEVSEHSFQEIIRNYNINLRQIELRVRDIAKKEYSYYQYKYDKNHHFLVNAQTFISPTIGEVPITLNLQTNRKKREELEQALDPFRMSFGKGHGASP